MPAQRTVAYLHQILRQIGIAGMSRLFRAEERVAAMAVGAQNTEEPK